VTDALIQVRGALCRLSANHTLRISHLDIIEGQHLGVFGGNGAGKSTLLRLLMGTLPSGRNHVQYRAGFDPNVDCIVVSFEQQQALWALDNRHDISEYSEDARDQGTTVAAWILGPGQPDARYEEVLTSLGLKALEGRGMRYLSSGQCRKAMLAKALYQRPRLLILDDPLGSIDQVAQAQISSALLQWMTPTSSTLLLSRRAADILPGISHLVLMDELCLVAQGELASMRADPRFCAIAQRPLDIPKALPAPAGNRHSPPLDPVLPLIELREVFAAYHGERVLENLSWTMSYGQHTLIEGPNGCGKSTLLSLVDGENHMAYGQEVYLFGKKRGSGETIWNVKARFGVVSNEMHNRYVKGWRVLEVVISGFFDSVGLYDESGASERSCAMAWLKALNIEALAKEYYDSISFGQQRLVLLARAMLKHPNVLILDEPCVGLDDGHRDLILALADLIAATTATHILYVSHTQGERPRCINQCIRFSSEGIVISPAEPRRVPLDGLAKSQKSG
jgi:molybdate transport system ATP-binding protein